MLVGHYGNRLAEMGLARKPQGTPSSGNHRPSQDCESALHDDNSGLGVLGRSLVRFDFKRLLLGRTVQADHDRARRRKSDVIRMSFEEAPWLFSESTFPLSSAFYTSRSPWT
jgi:hypothetical protein